MLSIVEWPAGPMVLIATLVVCALALRAWAPRERRGLRSATAFTAAYLIGLGARYAALLAGAAPLANTLTEVTAALGWIALIHLSGLFIFRALLPRFRIGAPTIVGDLAVGAAFFALGVSVLHDLGVDPTSIVATSAVVTGILALSLQPTLGNIIGGVALQLDRSVRVGDWLQLENGTQGLVREIRWRHTVVETRNWDTIIVPNSNLLAADITILGKRQGEPSQHRMWVYFNVDFRFEPARVIAVTESALQAPPAIAGVAELPPPNCVCLDFSNEHRESYALYAVRYWLTDLAADDPTSSLVRQRVYAALRRAGIPLAIPATQLFVQVDDRQRREEKHKHELAARLQAVASVDFLKVLTREELERVAAGLRTAPFAAGETIAEQGADAHWLYILVEGSAEVWVNEGARRARVATLQAPTFFGEMGLMTGEPRRATVVASTPVVCQLLYRDQFRSILAERPAIVESISQLLAAREIELRAAQSDLAGDGARATIATESTRLLSRIQTFFGLD